MYRDKLLRQQNKNQVSQLEQQWQQERSILQQDILNLQNSTDLKLIEQGQLKVQELEAELQKKQKLLDDTVNLLGSEDIKNLTDLINLLQGQTLKELVNHKDLLQQKIKDQDKALLNLAKQKLVGKKEAEKLLSDLETKWKERETRIAQEREIEKEAYLKKQEQLTEELKQERKEKQDLEEKIKTLSSDNDKLVQEKDNLIFDKNSLNEKILSLTQGEQVLNHRLEELAKEYQQQLRKINVIFDEGAQGYETIDFNGLFSLLQKVNYDQKQSSSTIQELKNQLENTQKLVSTDKQTLVDQSAQKDWQIANCQKTAEDIEKIINTFYVKFVGRDKVLNYLNQIIKGNYE